MNRPMLKIHVAKVLFILVLNTLLAPFSTASEVFVTSFEAYPLSSIHGQPGWEIDEGTAYVTDLETSIYKGTKGLRFIADNQKLVVSHIAFDGSEQGVSGIVYVDLWVKIQSMAIKDFAISGYDLFGGSNKRSFVMEFDTPSGSSGDFRIYNGSSKQVMGTYHFNEWNRLSARVDYDSETYQVIFNGSAASTANFRESYTPKASGNRPAGVKEYHEMRFNLGYNGATGSVDASVDEIAVSTTPIADVRFPVQEIVRSIEVEQPAIGQISLDPDLDEYPDGSDVTATLTLPAGYRNAGWTGDLSGTELETTFTISSHMTIGAEVEINPDNPPPLYHVTVEQPEVGQITLNPPGGLYYDYTNVTATLTIPPDYLNAGWTGDLSGTELEQDFVVNADMGIGATVVVDTTPPTIYTVSSGSELKSVCKGTHLRPGDIVEVADGPYDSGGITVESSGTANKPIIIRAKNMGGAELTGGTYFTFRKVEHVQLIGFVITSSKYTAVKLEACNHIRISRNVFQLTETEGKSGKWLYIGGFWNDDTLLSHHNRIDHNTFRHKHQLGNYLTIDGGNNVSQHDRIDHNYFYDIGPRHDNEMEAIRIGWSGLSLTDGFTIVEENLFEACDGDPEIVSVKSGKNIVRYNTFRGCQGTLSLRHGDGSSVYGNFFLGEGKVGTGGIRLYARNHQIYNNYFEGLTGMTWDAALTLTNGDTDTGSLSAHWRINNVIISHNTLVNNISNIEIGYAKADGSWRKEPYHVTFANNLIMGGQTDLIAIMTEPNDLVWHGNIMYPQPGRKLGITADSHEILQVDPQLEKGEDIWQLSSTSPAIDAVTMNYLPIIEDIQGQARVDVNDVGADEFSNEDVLRRPLNPEDVGPDAFTEDPNEANPNDRVMDLLAVETD